MSVRIQRGVPEGEEPSGSLRAKQKVLIEDLGAIGPEPVIEEDLIIYLNRLFPVTVSRSHDLRTYDTMCGHREVIDALVRLRKEQQTR